MKNFLKISLACLCLLISSSVLKAQCGTSFNQSVSMGIISQVETATHIFVTVGVQTVDVAASIEVGDKTCQNTNSCFGDFVIAKECKTFNTCLECTVKGVPTAREIKDGCIVIVGPKDCD